MKRILAIIVTLILTVMLFAGCGGRYNKAADTASGQTGYATASRGEGAAPAYDADYAAREDYGYSDDGGKSYTYTGDSKEMPVPVPNGSASSTGSTGSGNTPTAKQADSSDKIIYSGYAEIESVQFDATVDHVYKMIERYDGFLESSYVTGNNYKTRYYDSPSFRTAHFVIRIPKEHFEEIKNGLTELGNVTYTSAQAENITTQYNDTQSRLKAYRTEEDRLLDILEKADTVADMITIEDRLSQVRYNIESLTTQLTGWDSKINYSTLELSISEVEEFSEEPVIKPTFWQEIVDGVTKSVKGLVRFCKGAVVFIVSAIPALIIPIIIVVIVLLAIRAKRRKKTNENIKKDDETGKK